MNIRETSDLDLDDILFVERSAFGQDTEAELTRELLNDPSAKPFLSLLAFQDDKAVGHILFTKARLIETSKTALIAPSTVPTTGGTPATDCLAILAPLAIVPNYQRQEIGGKLIERGLEILSKSGIDLV